MRNGIVSHTAEGALGGALGAWLYHRGFKRVSRQLPERLKPPAVRRDPVDYLVSQVEHLRRRPLPRSVHDGLAQALRWGYGIGWGGLLGLITARRRVRTGRGLLLTGLGMGALVWAIDYAVFLPAAKLTPPVHRQGGRHVASSVLAHLAFGVVSCLPLLIAERRKLRQPAWKRGMARLVGRGLSALRG